MRGRTSPNRGPVTALYAAAAAAAALVDLYTTMWRIDDAAAASQ